MTARATLLVCGVEEWRRRKWDSFFEIRLHRTSSNPYISLHPPAIAEIYVVEDNDALICVRMYEIGLWWLVKFKVQGGFCMLYKLTARWDGC